METTKRPVKRYPAELRERAVRMVREHASEYASAWAAMRSIAEKVVCTPETLRLWARQAERDRGERSGLSTASGHG
jgi:transposase-like protein